MSEVRIVEDSISRDGARLTTLVLPIWRCLLAEFNTHRDKSRNSASSRAIPVSKMVQRILDEPFVPDHWGANQRGMRAGEPLSQEVVQQCRDLWLEARDYNLSVAKRFETLGLHKSIPNRLLEPWMTTEIVVTATEWQNFAALRTELTSDGTPMAEPHFHDRADELVRVLNASTPYLLEDHEWHLPFLRPDERAAIDWGKYELSVLPAIKRSVARCARVSYLRHDGLPATNQEDFQLFDSLLASGHMSPFEHQAKPGLTRYLQSGNFTGWMQFRKQLPGEVRSCDRLEVKVVKGARRRG